MQQDLTSRQWRALAAVYHLYVPAQRVEDSDDDATELVQRVLPLLQRAFPPELLRSHHASRRGGKRPREAAVETWRRLIPAGIDAHLRALLSAEPSGIGGGERKLLRLLNGEQRRAEQWERREAEMRQRLQRAAEKLLRLASDDGARESSGRRRNAAETRSSPAGAHTPNARPEQTPPPNPSRPRSPSRSGENGAKRGKATLAAAEAGRAVSPFNGTNPSAPKPAAPTTPQRTGAMAPTPNAAIATRHEALVCVRCEEAGGELFRCAHCGDMWHEACGGPKVESEMGMCDRCCRELGLSVSACSLRSSTSTEERGDGAESDTSLSGFIVRSDEEEDSGSSSSSAESSSSESAPSPPEKRRHRRRC